MPPAVLGFAGFGLALDYAVRRRAGGAAGSQERAAEAPVRAIRRE